MRRAQTAIADWGTNYGDRGARPLRHPPAARAESADALHRLFKGLGHESLKQAVSSWVEQVGRARPAPRGALAALALDGKSLRGSAGQGAAQSHLLSALSQRLGVVMAQLAVADKSHELDHFEPLLEALVFEGRVITCDALHTHAAVARKILAGGADYLLPVKDNQPVLRADIELVFAHA